MRVTERSKFLALKRRIQRRSGEVQEATEQIASGVRLRSRDQDVVASANLEQIERTRSQWDGFARAGQTIREELEVADGALEGATQLLRDAADLAAQVGSGPRTPTQLAAASEEAAQLFDALRSVANTRHRGQYVFAGVASSTEPFDASGNFQGSAQLREVEYRPGDTVKQPDGAAAFGAAGGVDAFATLSALRDAFTAGDQDRARQLGDDLRSALTQITRERQDLGARLDALEHAEAFRDNLELELEQQRSELRDTDIADAVTRLQLAQTSLQASAELSNRLRSMDILSKL